MGELAPEAVITVSFFPKWSAFFRSVVFFCWGILEAQILETVSELALLPVRTVAHFGIVFAHLGFVFTDFNGGFFDGIFITELIVSGVEVLWVVGREGVVGRSQLVNHLRLLIIYKI